MLHDALLPLAIRLLSDANARQLEEDVWRIERGWYGPGAALAWRSALFIGGGSGVEIVLFGMRNPRARILVVDPNPGLLPRLEGALGRDGRLHVFGSLVEAIQWNAGSAVEIARLALGNWSVRDLESMLNEIPLLHICGEASPGSVDELRLRKICQTTVRSFFFRIGDRGCVVPASSLVSEVDVTVVVPVYNLVEYLDRCLGSLSAQILKSIEVLIIDDGSLDCSAEIAKTWCGRFPDRFTLVEKVNGGCASARMEGLRRARGEFVGFVDGDDWVEPTMFDELYRAAVLSGAEIAQCGYYEAFEDGSRKDHPSFEGSRMTGWSTGVANGRDLLLSEPSIWRRIYRRDFLQSNAIVFPEHIRRFDDLAFAFGALSNARRVATVAECLYAYRQGRPGQDISVRDERLMVHFEIFDWLHERYGDALDKDLFDKLLKIEHATHRWALSRIRPELKRQYRRRAKRALARRRSKCPLRSGGLFAQSRL